MKNIKKINGVKISEIEKRDEYDYDQIMNFHANQLKKEKDQFEVDKKRKMKEAELWARAQREEEKRVTEKYCE